MDKVLSVIGLAVLTIVLVAGLSLLMAYPIMWLVNYLFTTSVISGLFGIAQLTFWKAFWLNFLCGQLFKNSTSTSSK